MVLPHGGKLINKIISPQEKGEILDRIRKFKFLTVDKEKVEEIKNIGRGVYSPLSGFLRKKDFESVVSNMRLKNGVLWPIPIVLDISDQDYQNLKNENALALYDKNKEIVALLENIEFYSNDKDFFAKNVYGTLDNNHPGVREIYKMGDFLVGGEIKLLNDKKQTFPKYNFSPRETREIFQKKGWKTVVAFQTRNVPHLGHEFLQKYALKGRDGLFIQPVIGEKKIEDFKDEFILTVYEVLIDRHYPKEKVVLGILPLKMRYAGPREAVFHALIRKNFGCTHFIVGRDHAGVGKYYPPFAAQTIFNQFKKTEVGIEILKYPEVIFCKSCKKHVFLNTCSHSENDKIYFSGTKLREKIKNGQKPPFNIIRPETYYLLSNSANPLVDHMYKRQKNQKGFTLWFTGLSQAGKTTIGNRVYQILKERGVIIERLDGDIVRQSLSKDLGFSKDDREENIKRVGSLAKLFNQKGVAVIASFISPYQKIRQELREKIPSFIEVFTNASLEVCEKRDIKGLYKKARKGEIPNFTGISDPYEAPENPEIELKTDAWSIQECTKKVIQYLEKHQYINGDNQ